MSTLTGTSTAEIDAPLEQVWKQLEEVEAAPEWQGGLDSVAVLERDDRGRGTMCEVYVDMKVRTTKTVVRFAYDGPRRLSWTQVEGDMKSGAARWELEEAGDGRTRATYTVEVDFGRILGVVLKPVEGVIRQRLAGARAGELKKRIEGGD